MSVQHNVELIGFPDWVVKLLNGIMIDQAEGHVVIDVPKAKLTYSFEVAPDAPASLSAGIVRHIALVIWETRDKRGKLLPA